MREDEPNVILLTIDALRADHCSWHGYDRETTKFLDEFAEKNLTFTNAYSVSSHTREAVPAILSGEYPDQCLDDDFSLASKSLAGYLTDAGYTTGSFHSNPFISRAYGFDENFDTFDDDLYLGRHRLIALAQRAFDRLRNRHYAQASTINDRSLSWVHSVDGPLFLWNHYMDPHGPYCPPEEYQMQYHDETVSTTRAQELYSRACSDGPDELTPREREELLRMYDSEIRYTDSQIEALIESLKDGGVFEDSLVIVTADHGDGFGEHDYYGHPRRLHDELVRVPLVVSTPGRHQMTIDDPVSTVDIVPTVLDVIETTVDDFCGESLLSVFDQHDCFADRTVYSQARGEGGDANVRRFRAVSSSETCYVERDSETGQLTEQSNASEPLRTRLERYVASRPDVDAVETDDHLSADATRRLQSLGYRE